VLMSSGIDYAVEFRGVVALLGVFPALSGLDLTVNRGEVVALRGPNGAGKTTVLKVAAGLVAVQRGNVTVFGSDVTVDRRSVRRFLGYLSHATGLYSDLSVRDNVTFAARAAGIHKAEMSNRVSGALERVGLEGRLAGLGVSHLSAGQRRRVALASLLARDVPLWLLDEPHAALDPDGRDLLDGLISEVSAAGTTVLLASHDLDRADRIANRIVSVQGGRIAAELGAAS
jgi:heme ABC exporter ATP-binding subunit CcmA